jgi:glycosyltransferase involved in cell wall biosynthesis
MAAREGGRPGVTPPVAIVLATYNGGRYLDEQIRSLQAQDVADWRLLVRDDGSTDDTPYRLRRFASEDSRISVLGTDRRLGVVRNFGELLRQAHLDGAEYVFLCDQDDVWRPDKLRRSLSLMSRLEAEHGHGVPLLVHSDLEVVDLELRQVHPSFLEFQGIRHEERDPLQVLLAQNFVTGCASLLNRALLEFALPIPDACIMHDWWLAQCAAARGALGFLPEPTIRYRQHAANQIGAGGAWANLNVLNPRGRRLFAASWRVGFENVGQAHALHERMIERGGARPDLVAMVNAYALAGRARWWQRLRMLHRFGIHRQRLLRTAFLFLQMALLGVAADKPCAPRASSGPGV